jgi:hypothetical protein
MDSPSDSLLRGFLARYPSALHPLILAARALLLESGPGLLEQFDPSANLIGYGTDSSYIGLVFGIMIYPAYLNLMFARGALLPDPDGLLLGTGKKARHIRIATLADLQHPGVRRMLESAISLHQEK